MLVLIVGLVQGFQDKIMLDVPECAQCHRPLRKPVPGSLRNAATPGSSLEDEGALRSYDRTVASKSPIDRCIQWHNQRQGGCGTPFLPTIIRRWKGQDDW